MAPRSWVLPSGHTPGIPHDRPAKPVHDLLFEDHCALNTVTEEDMERGMKHFAAGWHKQPPCAEYSAPRINV
ncbi:unnamed protein product [Schistocephalus solidus]|uniref:Uncharacterized protein n=1 Tax=Schistocephalus solidus TaxID=70667 RepID=A0A183T2C0_SCHSO|nr:unnamed protein product [Schistocephalus solidus]